MIEKELKRFFLITDTHVGNSSIGLDELEIALSNMKKIDDKAEFVHLGDITNFGDDLYMKTVLKTIKQYFDKPTLILGNHDVRGRKNGLSTEVDHNGWLDFWKVWWNPKKDSLCDRRLHNFSERLKLFQKLVHDQTYREYEYLNCIIFTLFTEIPLKDACYLSQKQLAMFENSLIKAKKNNKLIIIFSHQALNNTHKGSNEYRGFGDQNDDVLSILEKYENILFFSGHIHNGLGVVDVLKSNFGFLIDTPSFTYPQNGYIERSIGYYIQLYDEKIQITPYFFGNFQNEKIVELVDFRSIIEL